MKTWTFPEARPVTDGPWSTEPDKAQWIDEATGYDCLYGICHVPQPGRPVEVWWLGFDCAHAGDLCPRHREYGITLTPSWQEIYRDFTYVQDEVTRLAAQLASVSAS